MLDQNKQNSKVSSEWLPVGKGSGPFGGTESILILQSFHTLKWAIGLYPLTESLETTAKGTYSTTVL